ncbi:MAG: hypothetical protein R8N23_18755 [Reichenbachiella sp.]|uniref:hypothetical protein n=1 Tax=Reichenbachiella sp. TaxID=2184521 RepID=UPI0029666CF5|nr:hypothetical protein [Reichenbachiella sp.]MDW3211918.1 hypothetical protein [Reichenbachiella sp.]
MKYFFSFFFLLLFSLVAEGQTVDFKLFEGSGGKVAKEVKKNKDTYRQIRKEQKAYLKEQRKKYKVLTDSVKTTSELNSQNKDERDSIRRLYKVQKEFYLYTDTLYSVEEIASWDELEARRKQQTLRQAENRLGGNYYFQKYQAYNDQLKSYQSEYKSYKDSLKSAEDDPEKRAYLMEKKKAELAEKYNQDLEEGAKKELQARQLMPGMPMTSPEAQEIQAFANEGNALYKGLQEDVNTHGLEDGIPDDLLETQGLKHFEGHEEALKEEMMSLQELKKKYSDVPNSNDLSTATKRNSLEGTTFWDRLVFGGTFQIYIDEQVALDLNPELAYLINKNFSLGIGGNYRVNGQIKDAGGVLHNQAVYGYRVFTEHRIFKSFFAHVEYEALFLSTPAINGQDATKKWHYSLLAGIEKRIHISERLEGQVALLYNFMYKNNPAYDSPWNLRVGFNLNKKEPD